MNWTGNGRMGCTSQIWIQEVETAAIPAVGHPFIHLFISCDHPRYVLLRCVTFDSSLKMIAGWCINLMAPSLSNRDPQTIQVVHGDIFAPKLQYNARCVAPFFSVQIPYLGTQNQHCHSGDDISIACYNYKAIVAVSSENLSSNPLATSCEISRLTPDNCMVQVISVFRSETPVLKRAEGFESTLETAHPTVKLLWPN